MFANTSHFQSLYSASSLSVSQVNASVYSVLSTLTSQLCTIGKTPKQRKVLKASYHCTSWNPALVKPFTSLARWFCNLHHACWVYKILSYDVHEAEYDYVHYTLLETCLRLYKILPSNCLVTEHYFYIHSERAFINTNLGLTSNWITFYFHGKEKNSFILILKRPVIES